MKNTLVVWGVIALALLAACNTTPESIDVESTPSLPTSAVKPPVTDTLTIATDTLAKAIKKAVKPKSKEAKALLKDLKHNPRLVSLFVKLADATGGEVSYARSGKKVAETVLNILDKHATDRTDIMILIDKTGSMDDDIAGIQKSVGVIVDKLKKFNNVTLGWGAYGDRFADSETEWFELHQPDANLTASLDGILTLQTTGGGDEPESVNDAIYKTIAETRWRPGSKRMMLVLGDAPSLTGEFTTHTPESIIKRCLGEAVMVNMYPVVISTESFYDDEADPEAPVTTPVKSTIPTKTVNPAPDDMITKIFPNPTTDFAVVEFTTPAEYTVNVKNLLGKQISNDRVNGTRYSIDLSRQPAGSYIVTVTNTATGQKKARQVLRR